MFVAYSGKDSDAIKALVDAGLDAVKKPLPEEEFKEALAAFEYHLLSDLQTPIQLADNFGWYSVEGAPAYAPGANGENGAYFEAAKSLTPEFVAEVAQKYLGKPPAVVTLGPSLAKADK
jgi:predicted Zn-dependent peptidase